MRQIRKWLLRLFGKQTEQAPMAAAPQEEMRVAVERRSQTPGREKQIIANGVEQFFNDNYELRFNILKQSEEFRPRFPENAAGFGENVAGFAENATGNDCCASRESPEWLPLTDRELRRIAFEQMKEVGVAWSIDIELYARSAMVPNYDPVGDFLGHCTPWDGTTDHIDALSRRVPTAFKEWPLYFHRWFLAMVAQWQRRSRDYGNSLVPMLIGSQGTHKSTFCKLLLPRSLREYYIDDIKLDSSEQVERMLARMLLVNIDEYNAKTSREQAKIKRVLTERDVQTRRMRSDQYQLLPRMASFIATTNDRQPLTDPTGSRRYICCDIDGIIDTDTPIDHRQLYAQAVAELRSGKPWYLSKQEEQKLEQHNQNFRVEMSPEQVLLAWYTQAERRQENFIRTVDILKELSKHVGKADLPTVQSLTRTLRACGFAYGAVSGQRGWYAKLR